MLERRDRDTEVHEFFPICYSHGGNIVILLFTVVAVFIVCTCAFPNVYAIVDHTQYLYALFLTTYRLTLAEA